jgi:hypothetical protein
VQLTGENFGEVLGINLIRPRIPNLHLFIADVRTDTMFCSAGKLRLGSKIFGREEVGGRR